MNKVGSGPASVRFDDDDSRCKALLMNNTTIHTDEHDTAAVFANRLAACFALRFALGFALWFTCRISSRSRRGAGEFFLMRFFRLTVEIHAVFGAVMGGAGRARIFGFSLVIRFVFTRGFTFIIRLSFVI